MGILHTFIYLILFFVFIEGKPLLLFANKNDIRLFDATSSKNLSIIIPQLDDAAVLDFHYESSSIFWTDISLEMIRQTKIDINNPKKFGNKTNIITSGLISPDGIACDWIAHKLYWTDSETNRIEVANLDGSFRKVLFWTELYQPRAVALVPMEGFLFWSDWGEIPKIERASMDGNLSSRVVIVSKNIKWPNGLTVDYEEERIYFADAQLNMIQSINYDGSKPKIILQRKLSHPFALTLFEDYLYWTAWQSRSIYFCNKNTGKNVTKLVGGNLSPMDIHAYVPERQPPGYTRCSVKNGGCSHLCLISSSPPYYSCACPTGVKLLQDGKTCSDGAENVLLLSRRSDIRRISLDTKDYTDVILPFSGIKHSVALDYDPVDGYIYWTDDELHAISRAKMDGSNQQDLILKEVSRPEGVSVDWVARNLYWTDTGTNRIEVSRLNGSYRSILFSVGLDQPRAIVVDPNSGLMFWSDWGNRSRIERAFMDGSNRKVVIDDGLGWPNGLAVDYNKQKLYWCDAKMDIIEMANFDGTERVVLISNNLYHIFGFSLLGDFIYWTDWQERRIEKANKFDGSQREIIVDHLPDLMGLKAVNIRNAPGTNPCAKNNGDCSHLCLIRPLKQFVCACPMGLELDVDNKSCIVPEAFLIFSQLKDIRRVSLELNRKNNVIPLRQISEVSALDFDFNENLIYWTDIYVKKISRAYVNGSNVEDVVEFGLQFPEGMTVDWIAKNIYWADVGFHRIEVASLKNRHRKVLIWENLESPRSLALDPVNGYMYWSDWSLNKIERALLDGTQRHNLINRVGRANGLTIDFQSERLFWADIYHKTIESCDLNGKKRVKLISETNKIPHSLTIYQDYLYWTDWEKYNIEVVNKTDGSNRKLFLQVNSHHVIDMLIFHGSRQPGWNECAVNNGGCSHLCLAMPSKKGKRQAYAHKCACPTHFKLKSNNRTCEPPKAFLLFSQKNAVHQMLFDPKSITLNIILPVQRLKNVKAIDYDPFSEYLYWIDDKSKSIRRSFLNGTGFSVVVSSKGQNIHPFDFAIDFYGRMLFWTCAQNNVINVTNIDSLEPIGVIFSKEGYKPRSIALHSDKGLLFWVNVADRISIERTDFDGTRHVTLFSTNLENPNALAVDVNDNILFWADEYLNQIESSNLKGGNRTVLFKSQSSKPIALSIHDSYVYWIDKETKRLSRFNKYSGRQQKTLKSRIPQLSDLISVENISLTSIARHACHEPPQCSHICQVDTQDGWGRKRCSCPNNMVLGDDGFTCGPPPTCGPNKIACLTGIDCIPKAWRCDNNPDCKDGSDEEGCPICDLKTHYVCGNGLCIENSKRCDGNYDCVDKSDESCCGHSFQCKSGKNECIDKELLCDGTPHCYDKSDEDGNVCFHQPTRETQVADSDKIGDYIYVIVLMPFSFIICAVYVYFRRKLNSNGQGRKSPLVSSTLMNNMKARNSNHCVDANVGSSQAFCGEVAGSSYNTVERSNSSIPYDRNHVTGASSSSSNCVTMYRETMNPPPSPVTDLSSPIGIEYCVRDPTPSISSTLQPYKKCYLQMKGHVPPPTPCDTDFNDDSDNYSEFRPPHSVVYNTVPARGYRSMKACNRGQYPAVNSERSAFLSDDYYVTSSPPSPGTERSFYNPNNPPPSPSSVCKQIQ